MPELTRRDFLTATSVAAAAALVVGSGSASAAMQEKPAVASRPRRTLKKAVMIGMVADGATVIDKFKLLRDLGFDGVEIDSPSGIDPAEYVKAQEATGIKAHGVVDSVHWQHPLNSPDQQVRAQGIAGLETALRDAHRCGSVSVLLVPAVVNASMPYDAAWLLSQQGIRNALPLAEQFGVKIAIENVWNGFLLSPLEAAAYVDSFKSPAIAWHFDIGNIINTGWPDQWIRILGPRIIKLHIKDFSRAKRDKEGLWKGFDVQLGEGDANWPAVMKALDEIGYSTAPEGRWATAEVAGGDAARLKQIAAQMDHLFAQ